MLKKLIERNFVRLNLDSGVTFWKGLQKNSSRLILVSNANIVPFIGKGISGTMKNPSVGNVLTSLWHRYAQRLEKFVRPLLKSLDLMRLDKMTLFGG